MKRFWIFAGTILGSIACTAALATGNTEAGASKATACQGCHGANGNSTNPDWPSLAGLGADYIVEQDPAVNSYLNERELNISRRLRKH